MSLLTLPRVPLARVLASLALFGAPVANAAAAPAPPAEATAARTITDIALTSQTVNQSVGANASVGTLSVTDDTPNSTYSYTLVVGGPDNSLFSIGGTSADELLANDASSLAAGDYVVRIRATDDTDSDFFEEDFTITVVDDVAPLYQNGTPSVSGTTTSSTTLTVRLNESGRVYLVAVADGDAAPSAAQVKAGQDASGSTPIGSGYVRVFASGADYTSSISGLSAGTAYDVYVVAEDDLPNLQASPAMVDVTTAPLDSDGDLTASALLTEPVAIPTTVDTAIEAVDILDFALVDGGSADGTALAVSAIDIQVSGSLSEAARSKLAFRLNGPDAADVSGSYNAGTVSFSGLSVSVADGTSEVYTVSAFWNDNTGLTEGQTLVLSVDGDTDLAVSASGTQMGATTAVDNGTGSTVDVTATALVFTTQPAGSVSGAALTAQPVVAAQDAFGNTDLDFAETVTLTEAAAGALAGDVDVAAVAGVATFADVAYTATADQEAFTLTADDEIGVGSDLPTVDAAAVTSDVVAVALAFATQPAPTTVADGAITYFTAVPVVQAVDANGTLDSGYSTGIVITEANGAGAAVFSGDGDTDGAAGTVTIVPSSGVATFSNLAINYTAGTTFDETFNLRASSGGLATADSDALTAIVNQLPSFVTTPNIASLLEDGSGADLNAMLAVTDGDDDQTLTWTVLSAPTLGVLNGFDATAAATGSTVTPTGLTYTPAADANGTESFVIRVSDGLDTADQTVSFTVTAVNDAPSFTAGADVSVGKNAGAQSLAWATAIAAGPADEAAQTLAFDVTTDNAGLFDVAPAIDPSGTLTFTPATNVGGTATVTVVLSDDGGTANGGVDASAAQTFVIAVDAANFAPTLSEFPALVLDEDETSAPIAFTIEDAETATSDLTVTATSDNAALVAADGLVLGGEGPSRTLTVTPVANASGSARVTVTVTDGDLETSAAFTVLVQAANDAPSYPAAAPAPTVGGAQGGADGPLVELPSETDPSRTIVLSFPMAIDAEGDGVQYDWAFYLSSELDVRITQVDLTPYIVDVEASRTTGDSEVLRAEVPLSVLSAVYDSLDVEAGVEATVYHRVAATDGEATSYSPAAPLRLARGLVTAAEDATLPTVLTVEGNYPNPVAQATRIRYALPTAGPVRLEVFDTLGRRVAVLVDEAQAAGWHEATLDASRFESGTYLYRVIADGEAATRSLVVVR